MLLLNKICKAFAKLFVYLLCLVQCFGISFIFTGALFSTVLSVWSIFAVLPSILLCKYYLILLIASLPLTLIFFIVVSLDLVKEDEASKFLKKKTK